MASDIKVPKIGTIPKPVVLTVAVGGAGFVAWRWWTNKQAANASATADPNAALNPDFVDGSGSIPGVLGAVPPGNLFGSGSGGGTTTGGDSGSGPPFTTNAAWSQAATTFLEQSDAWSFTDIATALGNYLANRPLTSTQQAIVQAAIAAEGYPPVGSFTIISGGNAPITIAPSGVHATAISASEIAV